MRPVCSARRHGGDRMSIEVTSPEAVGMSSERLARIRPVMESYVDERGIVGISTLISRRGQVVHAEQFGFRDREAGRPMTADTIFRIYSMTKPIISTALMMLHEEGRFQLEHPVAQYLPAFGSTKVLSGRRRPRRPGQADAGPRAADAHERSDLRLHGRHTGRADVPRREDHARRHANARSRDRRARDTAARLPAGNALALQRRHRRRGALDRGHLRPAAGRVPAQRASSIRWA